LANRSLAIGLVLILALSVIPYRHSSIVVHASDIQSPLDKGAVGLGQAVRRLGTIGSVLHTGAHPDDEDSGLLAYLARGRQARTAYLSLTRGDGGQNLIGPELYESLGVIRTEELLAARRLDGAGQFFTRAFDFGFSKSKEEALSKWDREEVLRDMVRVIRTFRPFVIASAWSGTPRDGHGHHQAAGTLTQEAYKAAADPSRFPEQIAEGLRPWKAMKLYQREAVRSQNPEGAEPTSQGAQTLPPTLSLNTGQFDPLFGRSYYEIAIEGRSQHRSQDQGGIQRKGPRYSGLKLLDSSVGSPAEEKDIFENIDVTLSGIAKFAGQSAPRLKESLKEVQATADEAKASFNPLAASSLTLIISRGLKQIRDIRSSLKSMGLSDSEIYETDFILKRKEQDFVDALVKAEGVVVDCIAEDEIITPGQTFNLSVSSYADGTAKLSGIEIPLAKGWTITKEKESGNVIEGRLVAQTDFKVTVAQDAEPTEPYWLKNRRKDAMFVPGKGGTGIEPLSPSELVADVSFEIAGQKITISQPAQYRFADKALGEIRRDIKIAPAISVNVSPDLLMIPLSAKNVDREVTVTLTNNRKDGARGFLSLAKRFEGTITPARVDFDLKRKGERASFNFEVKVSPQRREVRYQLTAIATIDGVNYRRGYQAIAYPHTESRFLYSDSVAQAQVLDVKVAAGLKVGYIEGAGDDFANALRRIDVDVRTIDSQELATGDLSRYDVIVTGIRAYEVRPDIVANNQRLLDYMRQGGTLIVQYNKGEYATGNFAPFPVKMARSPERVTDERAPVTLLDPLNPRFNYPNKIGPKDFDGWVQERGTYFFSEWDSHYKPTIESNDPGEKPKQGAEIIAQVGSGTYVYTGIAWFRQLPVGVPGAYRLIANLVSLAKPKAQTQSSGQPARR
jgi:LmbE family N-acetylglucosaminyl deacetylase